RVRVVGRRIAPADDPLLLLPPVVRWAYGDPALRTAVAEAVSSERFDLVQFEFVESGFLMPAPQVPTILTVHQLGFAQDAPAWRAEGGRVGRAPVALYRHLR